MKIPYNLSYFVVLTIKNYDINEINILYNSNKGILDYVEKVDLKSDRCLIDNNIENQTVSLTITRLLPWSKSGCNPCQKAARLLTSSPSRPFSSACQSPPKSN